jgi:hypothetical protein
MNHVLGPKAFSKFTDIYPFSSQSPLKLKLKISNYEDFFDQDHLDHPQVQEPQFITDTAGLVTINNQQNFQVLTQIDKQHVLQHGLTDTSIRSLYLRKEARVRQNLQI